MDSNVYRTPENHELSPRGSTKSSHPGSSKCHSQKWTPFPLGNNVKPWPPGLDVSQSEAAFMKAAWSFPEQEQRVWRATGRGHGQSALWMDRESGLRAGRGRRGSAVGHRALSHGKRFLSPGDWRKHHESQHPP